MEHAFALVVLTLLQLCRGDISEPEWFAANLVNEPGYTPKPITEIFTSDSPVTSKNPALFTQPTTATTSTLPPTSRPTPNTEVIIQNGNSSPSQNGGSPVQKTPELIPQVVENPPKNELPNFLIVFDPRGPVNPVQPPVVPPSPPTSPQTQATTQNQPTTATFTSLTSQSTMSIPSSQGTLRTFQPGNPQQILINSSPPAFQSGSPQPILTNTNNMPPAAWPPGTLVFPLQFPGASPTALPISATARPIISTVAPARPVNSKPVLTVRVKAPQGSITNILINPTTTVRPSTTRRRKSTRRTNNFESCMNACNGKKEPICSSPVGLNPINPDRLKGFPSLCHMACHNSFKKELYEKVTDGRCGKLRTRIRPVDKKKLNRDELNKAQYTIVHNAPDTVVEFSPVRQ